MAKKQKNNGKALIIIGIALLAIFVIMNNSDNTERKSKPTFDGTYNTFKVDILDHKVSAVINDPYWINLKITNPGISGAMFVQCSILDRNTNNWLPAAQTFTRLPQNDNCVDNEPFTQTAKVTLASNKSETIQFTMNVPNNPNGNNVIYCAAAETCDKAESIDVEPIKIVAANAPTPIPTSNNKTLVNGTACKFDSECKTLWFIGTEVCKNGYCMDTEDATPTNNAPTTSADDMLKKLFTENKYTILLIAFLAVLIGAFVVYKQPKKKDD
jgi:hypothetical protein